MDKSKNLKRDLYNISKKTGKGKIGIYYSYRGKVKRFPTGIECLPEHWEKKECQILKGGVSESDRAIVDNLYNTINGIINEHLFKFNQLPSTEYISENIEKPEEASENIHKLFAEFVEYKKNTVAKSTSDKFVHIGKFLKETDKRNKYNLNLNNFNYNFIEKFTSYLIDVRGNQNSSVIVRINDLKGFVKWINKKEIPNTIKPELWEVPVDNSAEDFTCLERNELNAIMKYEPNPADNPLIQKREQKAKDIIVFFPTPE